MESEIGKPNKTVEPEIENKPEIQTEMKQLYPLQILSRLKNQRKMILVGYDL